MCDEKRYAVILVGLKIAKNFSYRRNTKQAVFAEAETFSAA
jgi:hypothetical protein